MRAALFLSLSTLLIGGCCGTKYEIYPETRRTPEAAYRLFRAALLAERPDLIYESLSDGFKRRYGVPSLRDFRAGYELKKDEFDQIAWVVERAEAGEPVYLERNGIRFARMPVRAFGREVEFLLVELPTISMTVELEGYEEYGPQDVDYHRRWRGLLEVSEGKIRVPRAFDASETGVYSTDEVRELRFHDQWFLHGMSEELEGLLTGLSPTAQP
jgi:hypothetical protein